MVNCGKLAEIAQRLGDLADTREPDRLEWPVSRQLGPSTPHARRCRSGGASNGALLTSHVLLHSSSCLAASTQLSVPGPSDT